jgi:hypothetical protein
MPIYKIYAGKSGESLDFICEKEFANIEQADQYAFDCALDKVFPYQYINAANANTYINVLNQIEYFAEEA